MKKSIIFLSFIILGILLACVYLFLRKEPKDLRAAIPSDSKMVVFIDTETLCQQSGLSPFFNEYHENWEKAGLDLKKPAYGFLTNQKTLGLVFALNGKGLDTKNEFLKKYIEGKKRGLLWASSDSWTLCSDKDRCLLMLTKDSHQRNVMYDLMQKKQSDCQMTDTLEKGFFPVRFIVEAKTVMSLLGVQIPNVDLSTTRIRGEVIQSGNSFVFATSLETESEKVKKFLRETNEFLKPVEGRFFGMGPQQPLAWASFNVEGEKLLNVLRSFPKTRTALIGLNFCADVDKIIKSIDGDVCLSLREYPKNNLPLLFTARVSNTDYMHLANTWSLKTLGVQIGTKDDMFFASGDAECASHAFDLAVPREQKSGSKLYIILNTQKLRDVLLAMSPEILKPLAESMEEVNLEFPAAEFCKVELKLNKNLLDLIAK